MDVAGATACANMPTFVSPSAILGAESDKRRRGKN